MSRDPNTNSEMTIPSNRNGYSLVDPSLVRVIIEFPSFSLISTSSRPFLIDCIITRRPILEIRTPVITAPLRALLSLIRIPIPHIVSATSTAMSKLTKVRIYFCTRQFWPLCSRKPRNANFNEQMGSGFFANTTQFPYRRCALLQAKTLSLMRSPILHLFYMSAGSAIGLIYTGQSCCSISMATPIFRVAWVDGMVDSIVVEWRWRRTRTNMFTLLLAFPNKHPRSHSNTTQTWRC